MAVESASVNPSSSMAGMRPVGLMRRQSAGNVSGRTGTTSTSSNGSDSSWAASMTLRVCTENGTP